MLLLFDTPLSRSALYPLSLTRPVCDIRVGILTRRQWWQIKTGLPVYAISEPWLTNYGASNNETLICVDASIMPNEDCVTEILALKNGQMLEDENGMIAFATNQWPMYQQIPVMGQHSGKLANQVRLKHASDIFLMNSSRLVNDFVLLTQGRKSATAHVSNYLSDTEGVFLEEGAQVFNSVLNASEGPIYIGKNALVMEGCFIRGPVAIGEGAVIKMGAKIYGGTTIGPYCVAGGEIKNAMLTSFSNKAHDGYLGDSVVGSWCNLGAGTSNSNVKNTAGVVDMWHHDKQAFLPVGPKAGLIMGDYSRSAIHSVFNTGTVIGVSCNVFEGVYPERHLPSFSWGNYERYELNKACEHAANWQKMKGRDFSETDREILQQVYDRTPMPKPLN